MAMKKRIYKPETENLLLQVKARGFNIWGCLGMFKRRSKLRHPIPDEVIQEVCLEYLKREGQIESSFPYFLQVLKMKSSQHFSRQNEAEGQRYKSEPTAFKNILKELVK